MKIMDMQRQGEILFIKVDDFNSEIGFDKTEKNVKNDSDYESVEFKDNKMIVAHSETGHHHVIDRKNEDHADLLINKANTLKGRLVVQDRECFVKHLRSFDTHKTINLKEGKYVIRYRREHSPEGLRRVID